MQEAQVRAPSRKGILAWMIISQLLTVASLVFWLLMAGLSVMAFDSGVTAEAWTFVIAVWSYPIFPLVMVIAAWIAFARKKDRLAGVLSGLSFAPPAVLFLIILLNSFAWSFQHGLGGL